MTIYLATGLTEGDGDADGGRAYRERWFKAKEIDS